MDNKNSITPIVITREVRFGEAVVVVRELTLNEILAWMAGLKESSEATLLESLLVDEVSLADMVAMTDWSREQLMQLAPSQLRHLGGVCKEVNEAFFQACSRGLEIVTPISPPLSTP